MANVTIKKAKIKDNLFLDVEYSEIVTDGTNSVTKSCTAPVHDDLKKAFKKLTIHLGLLTEQISVAKGKGSVTADFDSERVLHLFDPGLEFHFTETGWNIIDSMYCSGFTIGGTGDSEGVTLIGRRTLSNSKVLNLVSPFQKWEGDMYDYNYSSELSEIIAECTGEVKLYLFEGKHQPEAQLSLFDQTDESLTEQERMDAEMPLTDDMAAKARKRGPKKKNDDIGEL